MNDILITLQQMEILIKLKNNPKLALEFTLARDKLLLAGYIAYMGDSLFSLTTKGQYYLTERNL